MNRSILTLLLVAASAARVSAQAVGAQPAGAVAQAADQYAEAAVIASKTGDFETAVDMYQKAFAISPHAVLLWDIAQAHRRAAEKLHDSDAAKAALHRDASREYFRKYLETKPDEEMEGKTRNWLAKLDAEWAEEHPKEEAARRLVEERTREAAVKAEEARLETEHKQKAARDRLEAERIASAVVRTTTEKELGKARTLKIAGIAGIGMGVIAIGTGVYFGLEARRISNELTHQNVYDSRRINDGNTAQRFMTIGYIAGGALVIGGAVTYWLGRDIGIHALEHTTVVVAPSANGGAVVASGSF